MSASDIEVIKSRQAITCSENCSLVKGKGRSIRTKEGDLQMLIYFDLPVPKLISNQGYLYLAQTAELQPIGSLEKAIFHGTKFF